MAGGLSKSQKRKKLQWINHERPLMIHMTKFNTVLNQAMTMNSKPTEASFPELPKVLIWMRCCIAIIYGTSLGIRNIRGSIMIFNATNIITFIPYMYCRFYLNANMESYTSHGLILTGVVPAIALTILIWIYYFTLHHEMEIGIITTQFLLQNNNATTAAATTTTITNITNHVVDLVGVDEVVAPLLSSNTVDESEF